MTMLELREQSRRIRLRGEAYLSRLGLNGRYWSRVVAKAIRLTLGGDTGLIASSIGFYTLFSLFPLILLTVVIASRLLLDPDVAGLEIMHRLEFIAPGLGELLGRNIQSIMRARASITGIALLILLWTASSIFTALTRAMDKVWGIELHWSHLAWRHRGLAILIVLFSSIIILVGSLYGGTIVAVVNTIFPDALRPYRPFATELWSTLLGILLFAVLYRFLPHRKLSWRDVLPGAILAGIFWELVKRLFLAFIDVYLSRSNLVYGSVTTIIVFLTWTYVSSFIFLFGAYMNVAYVRSRHERRRMTLNQES